MYMNRELVNVINLCLKNIDTIKLKGLNKRDLIVWDEDSYIVSDYAVNVDWSEKQLLDILKELGEGLEE